MCTEEMVLGFAVNLLGDSEECKKLRAVVDSVGRGVEVDYSRRNGEYHVVYLVSKLGGKGEKGEGFCL